MTSIQQLADEKLIRLLNYHYDEKRRNFYMNFTISGKVRTLALSFAVMKNIFRVYDMENGATIKDSIKVR